MTKIGIVENIYNIYEENGKLIVIAESEDCKVQLKSFAHYERLSEETMCFVSKVYVNDKNVGDAENEGKGGCTFVRPNGKHTDLNIKANAVFGKLNDYTFPNKKLSLDDVVEQMAYFMPILKVNSSKGLKGISPEVKAVIVRKRGEQVVAYLNKTAEELRIQFAK
jgi:hypothetical protein